VPQSGVLAASVKYRLFGLSARYDLGPAQLFYGFAHNKFDLPETGQVLGGQLNVDIGINVDSHELRLASNPGHPLQWTIGAYLRKAHRQDLFEFDLFGLNEVDTTDSDARAVFGEATYSIPNTNLDLTAGLRYYYEKLSGNVLSGGVTTPLPTTPYKSWNPRFSIAWHPRKNSTIYATASKGFRAGQFQPLEAVRLGQLFGINLPPTLKQDFIWTYEVGAKADFLHGALTAEGAAFYSDWKDVTVRIPISTTGFNGLTNSPGTHTKGVELALFARPVKGLSLAASGSLIDAHYIGAVPGTGIVPGADVEDVAKFTSNASADYRWPISSGIEGTARIGWQHTSPRNNTSFPNFEKGDTIDRVDARVGAEFGKVTLALFADNLTDDRGAIDYRTVQPIAPGVNDITSTRLRPRTFGIELNVDLQRPAS
ncbi:MAG TPA: TonB-dependent receptor, partial [Sphingomicrobium sp.]|nr:TonB-dependent receptor [Sphingomicrobium sp.]